MGKQLSWATIIIIVILSICVGIGGGILLSKKMENSKIVKDAQSKEPKTQEETIIEPEKEKQTTKTEETLKYDGTKSITIGGKEYKISYKTDYYDLDREYPIVVNLYLNDKKIRNIDIPFMNNDEDSIATGSIEYNKEYSVELHKLGEEYILVEIKNRDKLVEGSSGTLCVINLKGEFIGTKRWESHNEGITLKSTGKSLNRYEIYDNGFLIFNASEDGNTLCENKYVVKNNKIELESNKYYSDDEVVRAGK